MLEEENGYLKVDNWGKHFLPRLYSLYLKGEYCDITLFFEDETLIKAHKAVLMTCTDYFTNEQTLVLMKRLSLQYNDVKPIIDFIYTGDLTYKSESHRKRVFTAATFLRVTIVIDLLTYQSNYDGKNAIPGAPDGVPDTSSSTPPPSKNAVEGLSPTMCFKPLSSVVGGVQGVESSASSSQTGVESTAPFQTGLESSAPSLTGVESSALLSSSQIGMESPASSQTGLESSAQSQTGVESSAPSQIGVESSAPSQTGVESSALSQTGVESSAPSQTGVESSAPSQTGVESSASSQTESSARSQTGVESSASLQTGLESTAPLSSSQAGVESSAPLSSSSQPVLELPIRHVRSKQTVMNLGGVAGAVADIFTLGGVEEDVTSETEIPRFEWSDFTLQEVVEKKLPSYPPPKFKLISYSSQPLSKLTDLKELPRGFQTFQEICDNIKMNENGENQPDLVVEKEIEVNTTISNSEIEVNTSIFNSEIEVNTSISDSEIEVNPSISNSEIEVNPSISNSEIEVNTLISNSGIEVNMSISNSEIEVNKSISNSEIEVNPSISNSEIEVNPSISNSEIEVNPSISNSEIEVNPSIPNSEIEVNTSISNSEIEANPSISNSEIELNPSISNSEIEVNTLISNSGIEVNMSISNSEIELNPSISNSEIEVNPSISNSEIEVNPSISNSEIEVNTSISNLEIEPQHEHNTATATTPPSAMEVRSSLENPPVLEAVPTVLTSRISITCEKGARLDRPKLLSGMMKANPNIIKNNRTLEVVVFSGKKRPSLDNFETRLYDFRTLSYDVKKPVAVEDRVEKASFSGITATNNAENMTRRDLPSVNQKSMPILPFRPPQLSAKNISFKSPQSIAVEPKPAQPVKGHQCQFCHMSFLRCIDLTAHKRNAHNDESRRMYEEVEKQLTTATTTEGIATTMDDIAVGSNLLQNLSLSKSPLKKAPTWTEQRSVIGNSPSPAKKVRYALPDSEGKDKTETARNSSRSSGLVATATASVVPKAHLVTKEGTETPSSTIVKAAKTGLPLLIPITYDKEDHSIEGDKEDKSDNAKNSSIRSSGLVATATASFVPKAQLVTKEGTETPSSTIVKAAKTRLPLFIPITYDKEDKADNANNNSSRSSGLVATATASVPTAKLVTRDAAETPSSAVVKATKTGLPLLIPITYDKEDHSIEGDKEDKSDNAKNSSIRSSGLVATATASFVPKAQLVTKEGTETPSSTIVKAAETGLPLLIPITYDKEDHSIEGDKEDKSDNAKNSSIRSSGLVATATASFVPKAQLVTKEGTETPSSTIVKAAKTRLPLFIPITYDKEDHSIASDKEDKADNANNNSSRSSGLVATATASVPTAKLVTRDAAETPSSAVVKATKTGLPLLIPITYDKEDHSIEGDKEDKADNASSTSRSSGLVATATASVVQKAELVTRDAAETPSSVIVKAAKTGLPLLIPITYDKDDPGKEDHLITEPEVLLISSDEDDHSIIGGEEDRSITSHEHDYSMTVDEDDYSTGDKEDESKSEEKTPFLSNVLKQPVTKLKKTGKIKSWQCKDCGIGGKPMRFKTYYRYRKHMQEVHAENKVVRNVRNRKLHPYLRQLSQKKESSSSKEKKVVARKANATALGERKTKVATANGIGKQGAATDTDFAIDSNVSQDLSFSKPTMKRVLPSAENSSPTKKVHFSFPQGKGKGDSSCLETEWPWTCKKCTGKPKNFNSMYQLKRHMSSVHKQVLQICKHCGHKTNNSRLFFYHLYIKHGINPHPKMRFPMCGKCTYIALNEKDLNNHRDNHKLLLMKVSCKECNLQFRSKASLECHLQQCSFNTEEEHVPAKVEAAGVVAAQGNAMAASNGNLKAMDDLQ